MNEPSASRNPREGPNGKPRAGCCDHLTRIYVWKARCDSVGSTYELQRGIDGEGRDTCGRMVSARKDLRKGQRTDEAEGDGIEYDHCVGRRVKLGR